MVKQSKLFVCVCELLNLMSVLHRFFFFSWTTAKLKVTESRLCIYNTSFTCFLDSAERLIFLNVIFLISKTCLLYTSDAADEHRDV